jgi:hypothetical protein
MKLTPGSRWKSAVCDTEVVVLKAPKSEGDLTCGGSAMLPAAAAARPADAAPAAGDDGGSLLGKRYGEAGVGLELLCSKGGKGTLGFAGAKLTVLAAQRLPSSD